MKDGTCGDRCPCRDPNHPMHKPFDCGATRFYSLAGITVVCQLQPDHAGKHWDFTRGMEW